MIAAVLVRPTARKEMKQAYRWYEAQREGLGDELRETVQECMDRVRANPQAWPLVSRRVRRAHLRKFPYLLFFQIVGDTVVVHSLFHVRRNPKAWQRLLRRIR